MNGDRSGEEPYLCLCRMVGSHGRMVMVGHGTTSWSSIYQICRGYEYCYLKYLLSTRSKHISTWNALNNGIMDNSITLKSFWNLV